MAENQADDDEGFGDFEFISFSNSNQANNKDDEDWGDFIQNFSPKQDTISIPIQFPHSHGFFHPPNPINSSQTPQIFEIFNGLSDQWMNNPSESQPTKVDSEKNSVSPPTGGSRWEKARGAIPLSIFGDEEEEESDAANPPINNPQNLFTSQQTSPVKNGLSFGSGIAIKDIIVNLYSQSEQIKTENGSNSNSNLVDGNGVLDDDDGDGWEFKEASFEKRSEDTSSSKLKRDENILALSGIQVELEAKFDGDVQVGMKASENSEGANGQLGDNWFMTSDEFSYKPTVIENGHVLESGGTTTSNGFISDPFSQSKQIGTENGLKSSLGDGNFDSSDNFFEFKDSFSETGAINRSPGSGQKEDVKGGDDLGGQVEVLQVNDEIQVNGKESLNYQRRPVSNFSNGKLDSDDSLFGDDVFSYKPSTSMKNSLNNQVVSSNFSLNDLISNLYSQAEQSPTVRSFEEATENGFSSAQEVLNSDFVNGGDDFDDSWEFKGASSEGFLEAGPGDGLQKFPTESKSSVLSSPNTTENGFHSAQTVLNPELMNGRDDFDDLWQFKGASPEILLETGPEDVLKMFHTESKSTVLSSQEDTENVFHSAQTVSNSELVKGKADFDENSWEFNGALPEAFVDTGPGDTLQKFPTESKLNTFIDFYCRLKEESYCIALDHLDGLKKAKTAAALASEDAKAVELHVEIQAAYKKLHQESEISDEVNLDKCLPRNDRVNELLQLVEKPEFQVLESEFHLSKRISLAEKNLSSAIEIFEHAISMVKILNLGTLEDQFTYISTWSKILSACVQELKHGSFIWRHSLQKNIHRQILSKTRGQQYVLALGEIYRVAEVVRASTTIYKAWILSSLASPTDIFALLKECAAVWSDSRLEEALLNYSDQVGFGNQKTINALLESIKSMQDLDVVALQNHVFSLQEPICRLSLLSLKMVPDMKAVVWNGEQYFLPLANLWANLISSDPPKLPRIFAG